LRFSREREKGVKIFTLFFSENSGTNKEKEGLNTTFSMTSVSRLMRREQRGAAWDTKSFLKNREKPAVSDWNTNHLHFSRGGEKG